MKSQKLNLLILLLFFIQVSQGQNLKTLSFYSQELNDKRVVQIYTPSDYKTSKDKTYPLTIILDSEMVFDAYVGNMKYFAKNQAVPEHIVVGIRSNSNQAEYDFSIDLQTGMPDEFGQKYMSFVIYDLLGEYLEQEYRLSNFNAVIGHGETAAYLNYFLAEEVPIFNAYVSIDPKYYEGFHYLIDYTKQGLDGDFYFYYTNGYQGKTPEMQEESTAVINSLESMGLQNFKFKLGDTPSANRLLRFTQGLNESFTMIYKDFAPISRELYNKELKDLGPQATIDYLSRKYQNISYLFGNNLNIRLSDVYMLESNIIDKEEGFYLKDFGEMILDIYPDEPLGYYYLGLYYEKGQKYRKALGKYKEGFLLVDDQQARYNGYYTNIERVLEKMAQD